MGFCRIMRGSNGKKQGRSYGLVRKTGCIGMSYHWGSQVILLTWLYDYKSCQGVCYMYRGIKSTASFSVTGFSDRFVIIAFMPFRVIIKKILCLWLIDNRIAIAFVCPLPSLLRTENSYVCTI